MFLIHPIVEEYRLGYARLAAFLNIDSSFTVIRRFDYLHLRLLLEKQAHLGELERRLMKCDDEETVQLYASSCKQDGNVERRRLMEEIQVKIHNYDQSVLEYRQMLQLSDAKKQHLNSIKNWIDGNKPIVRSESDWVLHLLSSDDFIALKASDGGEAGLENLLDRALKKWPRFFSKLSSSKVVTAHPKHIWIVIHLCAGKNGRHKNPPLSAAKTTMDYKAVYVDSCSHVDHSSWCLDIHDLLQSFQSCGVFTIHGQHITGYVFHDKDDKLHHDYCNHIIRSCVVNFPVMT